MTDISTSFTATGVGPSLLLLPRRTISYSLSGTFVATLVLERTNNGGQTWETVLTTTSAVSAILYDPGTYRWRCSSFTSGAAVAALDDLIDSVVFPVINNMHGDTVLDVTDVGITTQWIQLAAGAWIAAGTTAPTNGTSGTGVGLTGPGSMFINTGGKAVYVNTNTILSPTWTQLDAGTGAVLAVTASAGLASSGGSSPNITISDIELLAIAGLVSAANKGIVFTGSGTAALYDLTAAALTVLSGATVAAMVDTLGGAASSGTGGLARVNSPTFVTPNIGNATGNISGNAASANSATLAASALDAANLTTPLNGDVTGLATANTVSFVGGQAGSAVAAATVLANAATSADTVSTIVKRDASGRAQFVDPSAAQDAATKAYVDSIAVGLTVHTPAAVATTANLTLSGEQTIDGVLTSATRILVKNQTAPAENGIYVTAAGAWTRATDMNVWSQVPGSFVFVTGGTTQASSGWANTSTLSGTIGVTAMTWAQFSQAGTYTAGVGLTLTGSSFSVNYGTASGTAAQGNDTRITGALQAANNLSDLVTPATAVDNLGGAAATGSGGLVRAASPTLTSPVFTTPNIGAATGSVSGNAGSATVLQTARTINGVSFNGSANIVVTAAGSTLSDAVPLTGLATQAAHTFVANATAGSAAPTAISATTAASELSDWNANVFKNFLANVIVDTSTARTLSATERGSVLTMNNASAITLTLHATADVGYSVTVYQKGAGQISFAAASGATIRNRQSQTKAAGQYALCTLICESNAGSAAIWVLAGDTGT